MLGRRGLSCPREASAAPPSFLDRLIGTGKLLMPDRTESKTNAPSVPVDAPDMQDGIDTNLEQAVSIYDLNNDVSQGNDAMEPNPAIAANRTGTPSSDGQLLILQSSRKVVEEKIETIKTPAIVHLEKALNEYENPYDYLDYKMFKEMDIADIADGLNLVADMEWGPTANRLFSDLLGRWSQLDPLAAAEYVMRINARSTRGSAMSKVLREWSEDDPEAAYDWFMMNGELDPRASSMAIRTLFSAMADEDLGWAMDEVWRLDDPDQRGYALKTVASKMMEYGYEAELKTLYGRLDDEKEKIITAEAIVSGLAMYYPEKAAAWIYSIRDETVRNRAMNNLVQRWGYDQPHVAANWVSKLPNLEDRAKQMSQVAKIWSQDDPFAVAEWLGHFPPSETLDPSIRSFTRQVADNDPEWAMDWTRYMSNEKQRSYNYKSIVRSWAPRDPEAARAYILNAGFKDDLIETLLRIVEEER